MEIINRSTTILSIGTINDLIIENYIVTFLGQGLITLTGIEKQGKAGSSVRILNSSGNPLTLKHNSNLSKENNRFSLPNGVDLVLQNNDALQLNYSSDSNNYFIEDYPSANGSGGGGVVLPPNVKIAGTNSIGDLIEASDEVLNSLLTGFSIGSNTMISASDTILQAFAKTQGQINDVSTTGSIYRSDGTISEPRTVTLTNTANPFKITGTSNPAGTIDFKINPITAGIIFDASTTNNNTSNFTQTPTSIEILLKNNLNLITSLVLSSNEIILANINQQANISTKIKISLSGLTIETGTATVTSPIITFHSDGRVSGSPATQSTNFITKSQFDTLDIPLVSTNLSIAATDNNGNIIDGSANVITRILTNFTIGSDVAILATDTILQAFAKVQAQLNTRIKLDSQLTGYTLGVNQNISATDTILQAFGKLQAQTNSLVNTAPIVTNANNFSLTVSGYYVFSGTISTWTLPTIVNNVGVTYYIKNRGNGPVTINSNTGNNDIFDTLPINSTTLNQGEAIILNNDGTYWNLQ